MHRQALAKLKGNWTGPSLTLMRSALPIVLVSVGAAQAIMLLNWLFLCGLKYVLTVAGCMARAQGMAGEEG